MIPLKGIWHIPALAFVLGGVLANNIGSIFYLLIFLLIAWAVRHRHSPIFLFCILSFILIGYFYLAPSPQEFSFKKQPELWHAEIMTPVKETAKTFTLTLIDETSEKRNISYVKKGEEVVPSSWLHGAVCTMKGRTIPFDGARNPGQFDYKSYMERKGIDSQVIIKNLEDIECEGRSWISYLYEGRMVLKERVRDHVHPEAYGWMNALIFGETSELADVTIDWFREFNLSHILAISGLHVGLTIGGVYFILFRTGLTTRTQSQCFILILLPVYAFLAGATPSVIRASLMASILILFSIFQKKIPLTDILSFAAVFLLVYSPSYFHHIGFQFSFLVTFSLVLSVSILKQYNIWMQTAVISLISQLSILALQVHYFYEFQPLSLWVNLILVPYFSFIVIPLLMVVFLLCFLVPSFAFVCSAVFIQLHERMISFMKGWTSWIDFQWVIGEIDPSYIFIYILAFVIMMTYWSDRNLFQSFAAACLTVGVLVAYSAAPYYSAEGKVTMLDVGQGDSFVVELPYRSSVIMIDAAGPSVFTSNKEKTADDIIFPYLKSRGIDKIDALFVSHEDSDHSGSVPFLLEEISVDKVYVSPYHKENFNGVTVEKIRAGQRVLYGNVALNVLHPSEDQEDPNDNSLVLDTLIGGQRWLFTGDISTSIESILLNSSSLSTDVLKVGHHGSHTSTSEAFIDGIEPKVALISAGVDNRYGHPHEEVVKRLEESGIIILQTNRHGAVQYTFSGQSGTFSSFLPYNASRE